MPSVPWHVAAGLRNIQRIHSRPRIRLRKNRVRVPVAAGAGMLLRVRMHASRKPRRLIRVAGLALHLRHLLRMRILLDVHVAIVALQAAVNAVAKRLSIHGDAVSVRVLHRRVAMARQAIRLRIEPRGCGQRTTTRPLRRPTIPLRIDFVAWLAHQPRLRSLLAPAASPILPSSFSGKKSSHPLSRLACYELRPLFPRRPLLWVRTLDMTPSCKNPQ